MKRITSFALAAFMAVAVMTACKNNSAPAAAEQGGQPRVSFQGPSSELTGRIVYVQMDSLIARYDLYIERSAELEKKSKTIETDLSSKTTSFEKDVQGYQEKVQNGLVTRFQAQTLEEELAKKQEELVAYRDKVISEFTEEESVLFNQIQYDLMSQLAEINADGKYDMILTSTAGNPVLMANPALNITDEVVAGLNKKYADSKRK